VHSSNFSSSTSTLTYLDHSSTSWMLGWDGVGLRKHNILAHYWPAVFGYAVQYAGKFQLHHPLGVWWVCGGCGGGGVSLPKSSAFSLLPLQAALWWPTTVNIITISTCMSRLHLDRVVRELAEVQGLPQSNPLLKLPDSSKHNQPWAQSPIFILLPACQGGR
jgi:hypothetical protein